MRGRAAAAEEEGFGGSWDVGGGVVEARDVGRAGDAGGAGRLRRSLHRRHGVRGRLRQLHGLLLLDCINGITIIVELGTCMP